MRSPELKAVVLILDLHADLEGFCSECGGRNDLVPYPCRTTQIINDTLGAM